MASIFLFSCGIPTICTLNNISIKPVNKVQSLEFTVKGTDSDLSVVSESCPGLLLCYVVTDNFTFTDSSKINSAFSKTVTNKVYIQDDSLILSTDDYNLYAFQADEEGTRVSTPSFSMNLHPYIFYKTTMNADLVMEFEGDREFTVGGNSLYIHNVSDPDYHYIHVFAAFSAEQGDFTNTYWSGLEYLGYIDTNE